MSAETALNVVRQIQGLAEGPRTPEMKACLGKVVFSLQAFLDHPDSRVRLSAARALLKLARGYTEEMPALDMSKTRTAYARWGESHEIASKELQGVLGEVLTAIGEPPEAPQDSAGAEAASSSTSGKPSDDARGEVILRVGESADQKVKVKIFENVVSVRGVVSVTVEGPHIIVNTRSQNVASDTAFLGDLLMAVKKAQGDGEHTVSLVSASAHHKAGDGSQKEDAGPTVIEDDDEPRYIDEDEDDEPAETSEAPPQQWTFFSQQHWMTGRRVQEFDDDPSIVSRLAKAKQKEEEKKEEGKTRLGMLFQYWTG